MRDLLNQHAAGSTKLHVGVEHWTDPDASSEVAGLTYLTIKGSPSSLRFLGELLTSFANEDHGDTFFMHPNGAGSNHFDSASTCGIYLTKSNEDAER